jgi:hypothetical protein
VNKPAMVRTIRRLGLALMLLSIFLGWQSTQFKSVKIIWELFIPGAITYIFARKMEQT